MNSQVFVKNHPHYYIHQAQRYPEMLAREFSTLQSVYATDVATRPCSRSDPHRTQGEEPGGEAGA